MFHTLHVLLESVFHTISTVSEECVPYSKDSVSKISALGGKRQCTLRTQAPVRSLCGPESLPQSRGSIPHEVQLHLHADVLSRLQVVEPFAAPPRSEQKTPFALCHVQDLVCWDLGSSHSNCAVVPHNPLSMQSLNCSTQGRLSSTAAAKSLQSCPTLYDPIDGSPAGSLVPGILQAKTQEWVTNSFSNA